MTSAERTATITAGSRWSQSRFPANFSYIGTNVGASKVDLRVSSAKLGWKVAAETLTSCSSYYGHYAHDPVMKWGHDQTYYTWTANNRIAVAVHEIGHSIGLDHNPTATCDGAVAGLMYPDAIAAYNGCGWTTPTTDDVNGAIDAHNG